MSRRSRLVFAAAALVVAVACGEENKVGSGVDLNIKDQVEQQRLGQRTTTTASADTSVPQGAVALGKETTTTAAPTTTAPPTTQPPTTQAPQVPTLEIAINSDTAGTSQFDPSQARVFQGSLVKWTNNDTKSRSVEADDGTFSSGPLAPGESYTYKATTSGRFNYHDGTRPYAVATLEVVAR